MDSTRLNISQHITIPLYEIDISAIRSQGPGGQHVNKVASAIQLRFNIPASSLPEYLKERLLKLNDSRISNEGVLVIKAQQHRSQKKNKDNALARLQSLVRSVLNVPKSRIPTKPTKSSKIKRMDSKKKRGQLKKLRSNIALD